MTDVTIRIEGVEELGALLQQAPKEVRNVVNTIVRKQVPKIRKNVVDAIHQKHGIPKRAAKIRRVRSRQKVRKGRGSVWLGHNAIQAAYLGKLEDFGQGAFAGQFFFKNAFIRIFKSGHRTLVRRVGNRLVEETADLPFADQVTRAEVGRLEREVSSTIESQLRRGVSVL